MGLFDSFIGKKGISMIAGIGCVSKEALEASQKNPVIEGKKRISTSSRGV